MAGWLQYSSEEELKEKNSAEDENPLLTIIGVGIFLLLLGGSWVGAMLIKESLIGWIDLTGGRGGLQPGVNFTIVFILTAGIFGSIMWGISALIKWVDSIVSFFERKKSD